MSPRGQVHALIRSARMLAGGVMVALASMLILTTASAAGAGSFGISTGGDIQNEDPTTLARDLDVIDSAGAGWVRIDINWAQIQNRGPSSYEWDAIDRVVRGATERGMDVLGVIVYTPGWARPSGTSASYGPDPNQYAKFASAAVEHYSKLGVHAYEVWNEPNIPAAWAPTPDRSDYTKLLKAAYPAIKAADPSATVLSGGTAPAPNDGNNIGPVEFLKGIYANGGGDSFDAVSHHPYSWPARAGDRESWSAWYQMYGTEPSLRSTMVANGDSTKKIWATEFGAPTDGPSGSHVSEAEQAAIITAGFREWQSYGWAGPLFTYEGRDYGTRGDNRENFFGLMRHDFSPKPAYAAYKAAATAESPVDPVDPVDPGDGGEVVDVPTEIIVKGKGNNKGQGKVKGRVSTKRTARLAARAKVTGKVRLRLFRRAKSGWRPASPRRMTRLTPRGKFRKGVGGLRKKRLKKGTYLVRVGYPGSRNTKPSSTRSRRFKVRR